MGNYARIIKEICQENDISCTSFSDDWSFRLEKDEKVKYIYGYRFGLDNGSIQQICNDKSIMCDLLEFCEIPHVEHLFFMDIKTYKSAKEKIAEKYGKVVCKANDGTGGNQVFLAENSEEIEMAVNKVFDSGSMLAISPYYEIDSEYRAIVLNGEIRLMYSKERPFVVGDGVKTVRELAKDICIPISESMTNMILGKGEMVLLNWKHNLGQGARPVIVQDTCIYDVVAKLVKKVLHKVDIRFASIDIVKVKNEFKVLEVNSGVMMEHFSKVSQENYKIAKEIYKDAILSMFAIL